MMNIFIDWVITFFADIITWQGFLGFFIGYGLHFLQSQRKTDRLICHSCRKGHYVFDPKRVKNNPALFIENRKNGYYCDTCGQSAPYEWKP